MNTKISRLLIITVMITAISSKAFSQTVHSSNTDIWLHYFGKNMLSKKLSFTFEGTFRFANGFSEKQQYFVRPSLDYQFTKHMMGSVGYSHYLTYVYGSPALNKIPIPENHLWLQTQFTHQLGKLKMVNRLRDEIRFVGVAVKDGNGVYNIDRYVNRNRLRYMLLFNYPLIKNDKNATKLFGILGNEAFFNIGSISKTPNVDKNVGATLFNQNRIIAGFGYNVNPHNQVQVSFINQDIWNFSNTIEERNPTVRFSYYTNFSFAKHK
ncbi:MAG: DUF2490 domain-containing protein [Bacteroidetes bacterium]|nr:DUF2490 domain-containing protein [Bacteroidota bacterium]